jgi:lysophospholipase L1-like esterase
MEATISKNSNNGGPVAPKDPVKKRPFFFIMQGKQVYGSPQPDGRGIQFIYENDGRLIDSARLAGSITDDYMLDLLRTTEGFKKMVHSIGVSVSGRVPDEKVKFVMQMYPKTPGEPSTNIEKEFEMDGMENIIELSDVNWLASDHEIGQTRFEFARPGIQASVDVRFYLNEGFVAPLQREESLVDFSSANYKKMIARSLMLKGNTKRLENVLAKAGAGEDITLAFIGGSITQGAGAIPIHEKCYPRIFADEFEKKYAKGGKVDLVKAGVGGTPSELGMIRFDRDVLRDGAKQPDLIVIEFAVNDEGDETKGVCFESLIRKALSLPWKPAVVILFAVFSNDWNLQERLGPVGVRYQVPMVSVLDAVSPQFMLLPEDGRVISKNQYFYDQYHPSNLGHQIMCDSIINLLDVVNAEPSGYEEEIDPAKTEPAIGADFEKVVLVDRKELPRLKDRFNIELVSEGSFTATDKDLQHVEMDSEIVPVPEFPYNWSHEEGADSSDPFVMKITCSKLLLVFKDSGLPSHGVANVYVDGKKAIEADPLKNGWTHCNAVIIHNGKRSKEHEVKIQLAPGSEGKKFTILGFGVVE